MDKIDEIGPNLPFGDIGARRDAAWIAAIHGVCSEKSAREVWKAEIVLKNREIGRPRSKIENIVPR